MPGFDGRGPGGQGAMTGGGRGFCAVLLSDAEIKPFKGAGYYGGGRGRGFRNCFKAIGIPGDMRGQRGIKRHEARGGILTKEDELSMIKENLNFLKHEIEENEKRVREIENDQETNGK